MTSSNVINYLSPKKALLIMLEAYQSSLSVLNMKEGLLHIQLFLAVNYKFLSYTSL